MSPLSNYIQVTSEKVKDVEAGGVFLLDEGELKLVQGIETLLPDVPDTYRRVVNRITLDIAHYGRFRGGMGDLIDLKSVEAAFPVVNRHMVV